MQKRLTLILIIAFALVAFTRNIKFTPQKYKSMEPRFNVLTLGVDNLEKSFKFYHEGLGFPSKGITGKEFEHGDVAFFELKHGITLSLYSRDNLAWDSNIKKQARAASEFSIGYTVRSKEEVDSIMETAQKAGAKIAKPAQKAFWGGYAGKFQDPDGHLWEVLWIRNVPPQD